MQGSLFSSRKNCCLSSTVSLSPFLSVYLSGCFPLLSTLHSLGGNTCRVSTDTHGSLGPHPTIPRPPGTHSPTRAARAAAGAEEGERGASPPLPLHDPLSHKTSLASGKFKDKSIKNSKMGDLSTEPCAGHRPLQLVWTACVGAPVLLNRQTHCPFPWPLAGTRHFLYGQDSLGYYHCFSGQEIQSPSLLEVQLRPGTPCPHPTCILQVTARCSGRAPSGSAQP